MEECVLAQRFQKRDVSDGSRGIYKKEPCMLNEDKIKLMTELALFEKKICFPDENSQSVF